MLVASCSFRRPLCPPALRPTWASSQGQRGACHLGSAYWHRAVLLERYTVQLAADLSVHDGLEATCANCCCAYDESCSAQRSSNRRACPWRLLPGTRVTSPHGSRQCWASRLSAPCASCGQTSAPRAQARPGRHRPHLPVPSPKPPAASNTSSTQLSSPTVSPSQVCTPSNCYAGMLSHCDVRLSSECM